ncbi:MAG: respiratory nitrate reductase subunit gamma [Planctomycetes bacterium]|nr:respiratory nitrate reductase subunit gamma [Planctomycetota bacterium]
MLDTMMKLFFAVLPYVALMTFFLGTIYRYRARTFSYSSLSSQFLENRQQFWGSVPFHYGILFVLAGHIVGFLVPRSILWWNSVPLRLYILETSAFIGGLCALTGIIILMYRRLTNSKVAKVTSPMDWIVLAMLAAQIGTGLYTAIFHNWGSSWYSASLVPYLWSIATFSPDTAAVMVMPWAVKFHIWGAFALIALFPFTRLVHILVIPNPYLWRKPQVVIWNWDRHTIRQRDY